MTRPALRLVGSEQAPVASEPLVTRRKHLTVLEGENGVLDEPQDSLYRMMIRLDEVPRHYTTMVWKDLSTSAKEVLHKIIFDAGECDTAFESEKVLEIALVLFRQTRGTSAQRRRALVKVPPPETH